MTDQLTDTGLVAGTWTLDPAHTTIGFTARHLMSKVRGTFNEFDGRITTTTDPLESTIEVTIKASSISTNNEQRDAHLRSADFFDPEIGGDLTFRSTAIRRDGPRGRGDHPDRPARLQRQLERAAGRRPLPGRPEDRHPPVGRGRPRRVTAASRCRDSPAKLTCT